MCNHFEDLSSNDCDLCIDEFYGYESEPYVIDDENIHHRNQDFEFEFESFDFDYGFELDLLMIQEAACKFQHRRYLKSEVFAELIASVMHPCRIQAQMDKFNDIEDFFQSMGY